MVLKKPTSPLVAQFTIHGTSKSTKSNISCSITACHSPANSSSPVNLGIDFMRPCDLEDRYVKCDVSKERIFFDCLGSG